MSQWKTVWLMPLWAKVIAGILVALIAGFVVALITGGSNEDSQTAAQSVADTQRTARATKQRSLARERNRLKREKEKRDRAAAEKRLERGEATATGEAGPERSEPADTNRGAAASKLEASFASLQSEVSGQIGLAYSLGPGQIEQLGSLEVGHAWSSFKVPIVVTLMANQGHVLTAEQESLAASAITASDNNAAAALFSALDAKTGGGASSAIEAVLSTSGGATKVATAPPPPGAVSSWGQTEWSLTASTAFYGALVCGAYGPREAALALGDMENVIAEQQWGLGQAGFPSGTQVAFKAGWGPDGSESGPYLVRQAGVIRSENGQLVVTIAAQDSSGSFEAGVADLDQVADWVAENLPVSGSC